MQRFRGGLVSKAHRRLYHSTLGLGVIKKKKDLKISYRDVPDVRKGMVVDTVSAPLRVLHSSRHKWPGGLVNHDFGRLSKST